MACTDHFFPKNLWHPAKCCRTFCMNMNYIILSNDAFIVAKKAEETAASPFLSIVGALRILTPLYSVCLSSSNSAPLTWWPLLLITVTLCPIAAILVANSSTTISTPPSRLGILLCPKWTIFNFFLSDQVLLLIVFLFYLDPFPKITTQTVCNNIFTSCLNDHSSMYLRSSFTTSSKSLISLRPLTCHIPVNPGVMLNRLR